MLKTINNKLNKKVTFMLAADPSAREDESFCLSVWTQALRVHVNLQQPKVCFYLCLTYKNAVISRR